MFLRIMFYVILFLAFVFLFILAVGYFISSPRYKGPIASNYDGKNFINPGHVKAKGFYELLKWMTNRKRGEWNEQTNVSFGEKPLAQIDAGIRITFVNHSTFLIQADGVNILTDPVWSERVSPFSWIGPKRLRPPGIRFEDLPKIDYVLISHNHYDHLDIETIRKIYDQHRAQIITPLGVKTYLEKQNITTARDADWWDEIILNDSIRIQAVPAQHFSGRGMFDRDATLWCGYVIKSKSGNIYFAGDTGYNENTFKEIGKRCKAIRLALIPIGAYKPEWFMAPVHCSPEQAVKIHFDLEAQYSIGIHYGTFPLADDGQNDPVNDLKIALNKAGITEDVFLVLEEGVPRDF